jgi:superfamily I DNA and/or RNA helicase
MIRSQILFNAGLIGTTLNMIFLSNDFENLDFDMLIIDEASIVSEPQLYWALTKCKMAAIIVGDCLKFVVPSSSMGGLNSL